MLTLDVKEIVLGRRTELYINKKHFLNNIVRTPIETHIKSTRTEELVGRHMVLGNSIYRFSATLFVKIIVAARRHSNVEDFSIIVSTYDHIFEVNRATCQLECLSGVIREVLLGRHSHCKVKVIDILTDLNWIFIVTILDKLGHNGNPNILFLIQTNLE